MDKPITEGMSVVNPVSGYFRKRDERLERAYNKIKMESSADKPFAYGMCWSKLFWIFFIGNFFGFVVETLYCLVMPPHQFEIRVSVVFGPFVLIYGIGALAMTVMFYKLYNRSSPFIFLLSALVGGTVEYVSSYVQQAFFGTVSWEYSDSLFNINGRTNLFYSIFWGLLGVIWVKEIYPRMCLQIERIPKKVGRPLTVALTVFMVVNMVLSAAAVMRWSQRIEGVPASSPVAVFIDTVFTDEYMELIYPNMKHVGGVEVADIQTE